MNDIAGNKHNVLLTNSTPSKRNLNHDGKKQNQKLYAGLTVEPSGGRRNDFAIKHRGTSGLPCQRRPRSPASGIFLQGHYPRMPLCAHTLFPTQIAHVPTVTALHAGFWSSTRGWSHPHRHLQVSRGATDPTTVPRRGRPRTPNRLLTADGRPQPHFSLLRDHHPLARQNTCVKNMHLEVSLLPEIGLGQKYSRLSDCSGFPVSIRKEDWGEEIHLPWTLEQVIQSLTSCSPRSKGPKCFEGKCFACYVLINVWFIRHQWCWLEHWTK